MERGTKQRKGMKEGTKAVKFVRLGCFDQLQQPLVPLT